MANSEVALFLVAEIRTFADVNFVIVKHFYPKLIFAHFGFFEKRPEIKNRKTASFRLNIVNVEMI